MIRTCITLLALLLFASARLHAAPWTIEPVDTGGQLTASVSILADPAGVPRIAYGTLNLGTDYAERSGGAWTLGPHAGGSGHDFALDNDGKPTLVISNGSRVELATLEFGGTTWVKRIVATGSVSTTVALDFDDQNIPHVAYGDTSANTLKHAWRPTALWTTESVVTNSEFMFANSRFHMALDGNAKPEFFWSTAGANHAYYDGASWVSRLVRPQAGAGAIAYDPAGKLHGIVTSSVFNQGILHAQLDGDDWTMDTIDHLGNIPGRLVFDPLGHMHTVYIDTATAGDQEALKHAWWDGAAWLTETIASWANTRSGTEAADIAIDAAGNLHVAFSDDSRNLRYAFQAVPEPSTWALGATALAALGVFRRRRACPATGAQQTRAAWRRSESKVGSARE